MCRFHPGVPPAYHHYVKSPLHVYSLDLPRAIDCFRQYWYLHVTGVLHLAEPASGTQFVPVDNFHGAAVSSDTLPVTELPAADRDNPATRRHGSAMET